MNLRELRPLVEDYERAKETAEACREKKRRIDALIADLEGQRVTAQQEFSRLERERQQARISTLVNDGELSKERPAKGRDFESKARMLDEDIEAARAAAEIIERELRQRESVVSDRAEAIEKQAERQLATCVRDALAEIGKKYLKRVCGYSSSYLNGLLSNEGGGISVYPITSEKLGWKIDLGRLATFNIGSGGTSFESLCEEIKAHDDAADASGGQVQSCAT
jgi:hypothetical protein